MVSIDSLVQSFPETVPPPACVNAREARWEHGLKVQRDDDTYRVVDRGSRIEVTTTDPAEVVQAVARSVANYVNKPVPRLVRHLLDLLPCHPTSVVATLAFGTGTATMLATIAYGATGDPVASSDTVIPSATLLGGGGAMYLAARVLRMVETALETFGHGAKSMTEFASVAKTWTDMAQHGQLPSIDVKVTHQGEVPKV